MEDQAMIQATTAFQHAAEQMRFYRNHEWLVTYYAMLAYAALAAAPKLVDKDRDAWRFWVSLLALGLVLLVALQAWRTLWYSEDVREHERATAQEVIRDHLPSIEQHPRTERSERPLGVQWPQQLFADFLRMDELRGLPWGLAVGVGLGAFVASQFLILEVVVSIETIGLIPRVPERWAVLVLESVVVVALILMFASVFILPDVQRVVACLSQPASGGP
jgi:hypothetical protein